MIQVFSGSARPVAMSVPQRIAMANGHGDSRSRRSRKRSRATGTIDEHGGGHQCLSENHDRLGIH